MTERKRPVFKLGMLVGERSGSEDKIGGLAFGFPAERWPKCKVCGRSLNYIAQFRASETLDLGADGRALYLFQCGDGPTCCDWEPDGGANAAIILKSAEMTGGITQPPGDAEVEPEAVVVAWEAVPESEDSSFSTYAGGEPQYVGDHAAELVPPGRFLLQLAGGATFTGPAPTAAQTGAEILHYSGGPYGMDNLRRESPAIARQHYGSGWSRGQSNYPGRPSQITVSESGEWSIESANFAEGVAYVHIDDATNRAIMFWLTT